MPALGHKGALGTELDYWNTDGGLGHGDCIHMPRHCPAVTKLVKDFPVNLMLQKFERQFCNLFVLSELQTRRHTDTGIGITQLDNYLIEDYSRFVVT